ncbi:HipA domain-containing protein [Peptoniphilaceae bacterium SGI.131]
MKLIDFTNCKIDYTKAYGGANGSKIGIIYEDNSYMLKFPAKKENLEAPYTNSPISEYIACNIIKTMGYDVQDTLLGIYDGKIVVACKDFEVNGYILKEFSKFKNTVLDSAGGGFGTELSDIIYSIENQNFYPDIKGLREYFAELFVIDAFIGNFDRHNGNWGFLVNNISKEIVLAPIFDCGSSLYPQASDEQLKLFLDSKDEIEKRIYVFPNSAIKDNGIKINYYNFLNETKDKYFLDALKKVSKSINLYAINGIIDKTPYISDMRKNFYKLILSKRKELIIDKVLERKKEINKNLKRLER